MSETRNSIQQAEAARFDRQFASKGWACFIYAPGMLALAGAFLAMAIGADGQTAHTYIVIGIVLNLVSAILDGFRRKIIRQDEVIKRLQAQVNEQDTNS